jgi:hypothetical protein
MKPLTSDENMTALDQLLGGERAQLARIRWQIQLHRDVLNSPGDTITALEAQAIKSGQAIEWMETQRQALSDAALIEKR